MTGRQIAGFALVPVLCLSWGTRDEAQSPPAAHMPCPEVGALKLPDVKITESAAVAAATAGPVRVAHCRVNGVIGTEIRFSLLMPDTWNGKFMMGGGGGYVGTIDNQARASVNAGFATVGTDTGHQAGLTDASWAVDNFERQVNFGFLAVHRTAEVAKAIVRSYYGADASRSYFAGCSNGGRQAMMEAQREQVQSRDASVRDYFRLFMMPGVLHCVGGPGPDTTDVNEAIVNWVEKGVAPDSIMARKQSADGAVSRTRPLCPYPQQAHYKGSGSIDEAASFACR